MMFSRLLFGHFGAYCDAFDSAAIVLEIESNWAQAHRCVHALALNANTSGLVSAMSAAHSGDPGGLLFRLSGAAKYLAPLYMLPAFQKCIGPGTTGWLLRLTNRSYHEVLCPMWKRLHRHRFLKLHVSSCACEPRESDAVVFAIEKTYTGQAWLAGLA